MILETAVSLLLVARGEHGCAAADANTPAVTQDVSQRSNHSFCTAAALKDNIYLKAT